MKETVTIYRCDSCYNELSNQVGAIPHLSLTFTKHSGRVSPEEGAWKHTSEIQPGIYQFCNTNCLAAWINKELVEEVPHEVD